MPKRRQTLKKTSHFRRVWSESVALGHGPAPGHVPGRSVRKGGGTGGVPQLVDGVFYFIFFGFSAARARARFREVVLHGTKDVENEFRVSEMYLGVWGSSRFVAESDLAFFGLAGPVTTEGFGVFRVRGRVLEGFWRASGGLLARGMGRVAPPKAWAARQRSSARRERRC